MPGRCCRRFAIITIALAAHPALADANPLRFSLIGSTSDERWKPTASPRTQIDRLGVEFIQPFASDLHTVLELGYLNINQPSTLSAGSQTYHGEYLGVGLSQSFMITLESSVSLQPGYRYQQAENRAGETMTWHQWWMNLTGAIQFGALSLTAGGYWRAVEGTQNSGKDFRDDGLGATLGAALTDGMGGTIGIRYSSGAGQEVRIQFSRQYR